MAEAPDRVRRRLSNSSRGTLLDLPRLTPKRDECHSPRSPSPLETDMADKAIVHVIGTGTIGEPLIGLLTELKGPLGIEEVTFHKRTPLLHDRSKVVNLVKRGARLCVDAGATR